MILTESSFFLSLIYSPFVSICLSLISQATEVLSQKRDERGTQFQSLLAENKVLESKVYELETQLRGLDKNSKLAIQSSEDR
jgi:cell division protein FtsB